jgi:hypothetical protein
VIGDLIMLGILICRCGGEILKGYILFGCIIVALANLCGCSMDSNYCCKSNDQCLPTAEGSHSCSNDTCGKCIQVEPLMITPSTLPDATVGQSDYSVELTVTGGYPPYTWGDLTKGDGLEWLTLVRDDNDNSKAWLKNAVSNGQTLVPSQTSTGIPIRLVVLDNTRRGTDMNRGDNNGAILNSEITNKDCDHNCIFNGSNVAKDGTKCENNKLYHCTSYFPLSNLSNGDCVKWDNPQDCHSQCQNDNTCSSICNPKFGDCDGNPSNGCETDFSSSNVCNGHAKGCSFSNENMICTCSDAFTGDKCDRCATSALGIYPNCFIPSSTDYCSTSQCFPVTPTGQKSCCYEPPTTTAWSPIDCSSSTVGGSNPPNCQNGSVDFCGQDAQYPDRERTFTCSGGPCGSSAADGEVVTDSLTGLMWQRTYGSNIAWQDSTDAKKYPAADYCASLNANNYGGYNTGWRLPSPIELQSLVDYNVPNGIPIDTTMFPGTTDWRCYLSSSNIVSIPEGVWCVDFYEGDIGYSTKTLSAQVRCVRGGPIPSSGGMDTDRFIAFVPSEPNIISDTVVIDSVTGLMWQREYYTQKSTENWNDALKYCEGLDYGGYTDWRLPNVKELTSLVNYILPLSNCSGNCPASDFPGMPATWFWSSSSWAKGIANAFTVEFQLGGVTAYGKSNFGGAINFYVRCVRSGP